MNFSENILFKYSLAIHNFTQKEKYVTLKTVFETKFGIEI